MYKNDVLIVIPAYNEADSIGDTINNLIINYPQYSYVIVNDGSTDNTERICIESGFNVISVPINLGIGGAVQTGYRYAVKNGYKYVVQMDGDGQHDPKYIEGMLKSLIEHESDIVIGSRFVNREGFQSTLSRRIGISILSIWGGFLTGKKLLDITSGFRLVNERALQLYSRDYPVDYPEPEAYVLASIYGYKIEEYPVVMLERQNGISSITIRKSIYYMIKVFLSMMIRRLSLGVRRNK